MTSEPAFNLIPDKLEYYDENIPCLAACPVHTNAGMYVAAIADGDDDTAYLTARLPNPLASICGRVCAAPCEDACRRGEIDRPIAIRALKRFVTEQFGPETGDSQTWAKVAAPPVVERSERIGIVGGGPAGLACAHDLRRLGYQVTIYEATDRLGGAMWLGIPEYRLDRSVLAADVDAIVGLGVEVRYNTRLGTDVTLDGLRAEHDAVFLGIGATLGRGLDLEGADADGVLKAIEFLINMNRGFEVEVGERVLVIGGGDVAMDAARTALRADQYQAQREQEHNPQPRQQASGHLAGQQASGHLAGQQASGHLAGQQASGHVAAQGGKPGAGPQEQPADLRVALDVARTASRFGARDITVMSLEARHEMPAHEFEIEEAEHEGIRFLNRRGPARITSDNGVVTGVETIGVTSVFDDDGRFAPVFDNDDRHVVEADTVILAIGQAIDTNCLGDRGPEISARRTIGINWDTGATSLADVWSGGDAAKGPRTLIDAVADGRRAAADIHRSFGGTLETDQPGHMVELTQFHRLDDLYDRVDRVDVATLDSGRRVGLAEVELGFTPEQARCEANRCLRCFANILLDTDACVLCALCADVCPVKVISLVPSEELAPPAGASEPVAGQTALLLDETACIRCGLCIERCPPNALSMGVWTGTGVPA